MKKNQIIAISVFLLVLVSIPLAHSLFPQGKILSTDIISNGSNLFLLIYFFCTKKTEEVKSHAIFIFLALAYTAIKVGTLLFMSPISGDSESSLGIIDYTPFFILLVNIVLCFNNRRNSLFKKNAN
jgi:hypothetical protein